MLATMNAARGLNRAWALITVLWLSGVVFTIWRDVAADQACSAAVSVAVSQYGVPEYTNHIPHSCNMFSDIPTTNFFLYVTSFFPPYYWAFAIPIVAWLVGYGVLWVVRGFRNGA